MIGALAAGVVLWAASTLGLFDGREDWRTAIAEYTHLYTNETFSPLKPDSAQQAAGAEGGWRYGGRDPYARECGPARPAIHVGVILSYGGSPMGVLAYVDPLGAPVLLCILANGAPDAPTQSERRGDLSLAWWSSNGRSHLVIGHVPEERAVTLAQMIEKQVKIPPFTPHRLFS